MTNEMARQGDLLFTAIDHLPEGLTLQVGQVIIRGKQPVAHRLLAGGVLQDSRRHLFLEVLAPTLVVLQEHRPIFLESGYDQVTRQREYTPETSRTVMD